jgi:hypothetical protein
MVLVCNNMQNRLGLKAYTIGQNLSRRMRQLRQSERPKSRGRPVFADRVIDKTFQRKFAIGGIIPIVIALPAAIKIEIGEIVETRFIADGLIEGAKAAAISSSAASP